MLKLRVEKKIHKPCPNYQVRAELGSFSVDMNSMIHLDQSQLRFYAPPSEHAFALDLKVGYDKFVPKKESLPANKLDPILEWKHNYGDFRTEERPHFITWRGILAKMLCSPYAFEPRNISDNAWKVAATLYNGSIYLSEIETEESKKKEEGMSDKGKEMCYWGLKFEDYVTSRERPPQGQQAKPTTASALTGTVYAEQAFCSVVKTEMPSHSIVMAAEVDCIDLLSRESPPQSYIELKTTTKKVLKEINEYKLMKWWAQSFLVGVPKITCGFRNDIDDGVVKSLHTFKINDIEHLTQNKGNMWKPSVCLNFLDDLLTWIKKIVVEDDPSVVYIIYIERNTESQYSHVSYTKCPPNSEHVFVSDKYLKKQPPPR